MAKPLSKDELEEILRLREQGKSMLVIAGLIGRDESTIKRHLAKHRRLNDGI